MDRFLRAICQTRHPPALDDWLALELDTMEHAGRMTDDGNRFARVVENLDEGD
jgi:hypothetical protein